MRLWLWIPGSRFARLGNDERRESLNSAETQLNAMPPLSATVCPVM
jgi:hypothetical protein